jgi:HK97 family phage prohead protease
MPLPKPNYGESESSFMSRCLSDDKMREEYPKRSQRMAICLSNFGKAVPKENNMDENLEWKEETLDVAFDIKALGADEGTGEFSGYGSIFGNKDLGNDIVMEGAFAQSIGKKGAKAVKMLFQHKPDEPIGVFEEIIEDRKGLKVRGRLAMGTQRGREVYELMKMGAIDGLSIGYRVDAKGYDYDDKRKRRYLKSVDLMEISAVTFPMNPKARVSQVKTEKTVREWEGILRDAGDLSKNEAKVAASAVTKALARRDAENQEMPFELVDELNRLTNFLKS